MGNLRYARPFRRPEGSILLVHRSAGHLTESQKELFNSIKRNYCQTPFRTFLDVFRAFERAPNRWTNMTCSECYLHNQTNIG